MKLSQRPLAGALELVDLLFVVQPNQPVVDQFNQTVLGKKATIEQVKNAIVQFITLSELGLGNVDNTSDLDKPISTAVQNALNQKQNLDSDLTQIAALTPTNGDVIQRVGGVWTNINTANFKISLTLNKTDVGLSNVDNTSDANKPISTATQTALNNKQPLNSDLTAISALSPSNDDIIQRKSGAWVARSPSQFKSDLALVKGDVGLSNVDNTSDANKPISTATQSALDNKQPLDSDLTVIAGLSPADDDVIQRKSGAWINRTPTQFKSDLALVKADVGLGNVDNTSDLNKPISTATQSALDNKQPLDSDLTSIAALAPSNDDVIQRKAGSWVNRTPSQFKTDLSLTKSDVGLANVDNTSDLNKPISTATQSALDLKLSVSDHQDHIDYFNHISTSGIVSGGVISLTGGVGFSISAGVGYCVTDTDPVKRITWSTINDVTLFDGDNFIYIDYTGSLVINSSASQDGYLIGIGYIRTTGSNSIVVGLSNTKAFVVNKWMNQINYWLQRAVGTIVEYGLNISEQANPNYLKVVMGSGRAFYGSQSLSFNDTSTFTKIFDTSDYGYIADTATTANTVTVGYYNDVTQVAASALVPMTSGYWKKDLFFLTFDGDLYYVYAQDEYATEEDAKAAAVPAVPDSIKNDIFYLASVVSQSTSTTIAAGIQDIRAIFSRLFERGASAIAATVIDHGDLYGLLDDDHTQYHNDTRGDARYYTKTAADARYSQFGHTHSFASITGLPTTLSGYGITDAQPLDSDLTAIAALTPTNDDIIQRKAGVWTNRSPSQFKSDLALTKSDVGLGNVDNTSDANKPISTATQSALDGKQPLDGDLTQIAAIVSSNDDIIQKKAGSWTNRTPSQLKTDLALTKSDVGLANVDNTSDVNKPISTATQSALDGKQPLDSDLTALAAIAPTDDDVIQRKAGSWVNRTLTQLKTDLNLLDENIQDMISTFLTQGNNITLSYNDVGNTLSIAVTPSGSDTYVQYNAGGVLGSSVNFKYDATTKTLQLLGSDAGLNVAVITNQPSNASSGEARMFFSKLAGKTILQWIGDTGIAKFAQPNISQIRFAVISPSTGNALSNVGTSASTQGTVSTPALASTNFKTQARRSTFTSGGGNNSLTGFYTANTEVWRGNAANFGGFEISMRFSLETPVTAMRGFFGITTATGNAANIDPLASTTNSKVGMAINTNTGNWYLINNTAAATPTTLDLGSSFPVNNTTVYELNLYAPANGSVIYYAVRNLNTGAIASGTLSSNLPTSTEFMTVRGWITNHTGGGGATAFNLNNCNFEVNY